MEDSKSILQNLVAEAITAGADRIEVEYENGYDEVVAYSGPVGRMIARLPSSSPEAESLREELFPMGNRKQHMTVNGREYELHCHMYELFGEAAFRLEWS